MSRYKMSNGEWVTKSVIDRKVREAKDLKIKLFFEEYGYIFCEECKNNEDTPIDCSHIISVDECQKSGRSELAWDLNNIRLLGRECHKKKDKLNLKFK